MATVLTIIPYKFYPPTSGGALRCFYNLREIACHHTVFVLTTQPEEDFLPVVEPALPEGVQIISIYGKENYKTFLNQLLPYKIANFINFRFARRSFVGATNTLLLKAYPSLISILKETKFDIVIYESLESLSLFKSIVHRTSKHVRHVYDAHNIDSELWLQQAAIYNDPKYKSYAKTALKIEKTLYKYADVFFCCSDIDRVKLTDLNKNKIKGVVIPNGVDVTLRPFDINAKKHNIKQIIFCGSLDYEPNREGILWFYNEVLPLIRKKIPAVILTVIGHVTHTDVYNQLINDASVNFIGKVENVVPYYKSSSIAVVPLLSGSGTRLKILEAMSMGNPIVSTPIGAEGLCCSPGEHVLLANQTDEFAKQVVELLENEEQFNSIRFRAYEFVAKHYDWRKIGFSIRSSLAEF